MLPCENCLENQWSYEIKGDWIEANCVFCDYQTVFSKRKKRNLISPKINKQLISVNIPKNVVEIHTDASFSTNQYLKEVKPVGYPMYGTLCIYHNSPQVFQVSVPKVESHLQYNSVFEFMAIQKAVEYAKDLKIDNLLIVTDSTNCYCWFKRSKMKTKGKTKYHLEIFNKIQELKKNFSFIDIEWRPREVNKAGIYLEGLGYE